MHGSDNNNLIINYKNNYKNNNNNHNHNIQGC